MGKRERDLDRRIVHEPDPIDWPEVLDKWGGRIVFAILAAFAIAIAFSP